MKVFVHACDEYVGRAVVRHYQSIGAHVSGTTTADGNPDVPITYDASHPFEEKAIRTEESFSDVVVYPLPGHEAAARAAITHLASEPATGREQVFVAISSPATWARTRLAVLDESERPDTGQLIRGPDATLEATLEEAAEEGEASPAPAAQPPPEGEGPGEAAPGAEASDGADLGLTPETSFHPNGTLMLTAADAERRCGTPNAAVLREAENVVMRGARPGKLATIVITPGMMYGQGECDEAFHPLFRAAWEGDDATALPVWLGGTNVLPTIHVDDLAAYVAAAAEHPPPPHESLLIAVDDGLPTQRELLAALAEGIGSGRLREADLSSLLSAQSASQMLVNLPMLRTTIKPREEEDNADGEFEPQAGNADIFTNDGPGLLDATLSRGASGLGDPEPRQQSSVVNFEMKYAAGPVVHMAECVKQFAETRGLTPLRILVTGPPAVGKTAVAARLAHGYGLQLLDVNTLLDHAKALAESETASEEDKALGAAVVTEMAGKGGKNAVAGRASDENLAKLAAMVLARVLPRNRGYVLDGWPKTLEQAQAAFSVEQEMTEEEMEAAAKEEAELDAFVDPEAEGGAAEGKAKAKPPPPKDKKGKGAPAADVRLVPDRARFPNVVVDMACDPEEALRRTAVLQASGTAPAHCNPNDLKRRQAPFEARNEADAADLAERVEVTTKKWRMACVRYAEAKKEAEAAAARKARRLKAKTGVDHDVPVELDLKEPADAPDLPSHGGFLGYFEDGGAQIIHITNECPPDPRPQPPPPPPVAEGEPPPPEPEPLEPWNPDAQRVFAAEATAAGQVFVAVGPAHNYIGIVPAIPFPEPKLTDEEGEARAAAEAIAAKEAERARHLSHLAAQGEAAAKARAARARAANLAALKAHLMRELLPTLGTIMREVAVALPEDPVEFVSKRLLRAADAQDAKHVDPYDDPIYEIQIAKVRAKEARVARREAEAAEKALRDKEAAMEAEIKRKARLQSGVGSRPSTPGTPYSATTTAVPGASPMATPPPTLGKTL